jgi:hypothetical protein
MPILPLDHPETFSATLGVMLYPATDPAETRKARAFAARYLAKPIRSLHEAGGTLSYDVLAQIALDAGQPLTDLKERWWGGRATGEALKTFFALANTNPALASWNNAIKITQSIAKSFKAKGARTDLWKAKHRFLSAAHLWGAWSIREGRFERRPEVGYDWYADFQAFLTEAEILREWGQTWQPSRAKSEPPLPPDLWRVPYNWVPPARQPGWPKTGMIPCITLPQECLAKLRPTGRPRKWD